MKVITFHMQINETRLLLDAYKIIKNLSPYCSFEDRSPCRLGAGENVGIKSLQDQLFYTQATFAQFLFEKTALKLCYTFYTRSLGDISIIDSQLLVKGLGSTYTTKTKRPR